MTLFMSIAAPFLALSVLSSFGEVASALRTKTKAWSTVDTGRDSDGLALQMNFVGGPNQRCKASRFKSMVKELGMCLEEIIAIVDVSPHTAEATQLFKDS